MGRRATRPTSLGARSPDQRDADAARPVHGGRRRGSSLAWLDCAALTVLVALSALPYVGRIGFYSDDWSFLAEMRLAEDGSFPGLVGELLRNPNIAARPVQAVYQSALFSLFELRPLGYHLVNTAVLAVMTMALYLVLREVGVGRVVAVAVPAVYVLLPGYSTNRFWFAAFGYSVTMAAYLISLYADLRCVRGAVPRWRWKALALISVAVSGLAYEIALPLVPLNLALAWWTVRHRHGRSMPASFGWPRTIAFLTSTTLVLGALLAFKAATAVGAGLPASILRHVARIGVTAVAVHFGSFGTLLPHTDWWAAGVADGPTLALAVLVGAAVFAYLRGVARADGLPLRRTAWLRLTCAGLVVFGLGYTIFITNHRFTLTSTGIANRVGMAGAAGAAVTLVGVIGWLSTWLRTERARTEAVSLMVAALCASGLLVVNALGSFWIDAWNAERTVLTGVRERLPDLPAGSTLILAGVCPYRGPAVVFESNWDLEGALRLLYGDPTLEADVVTPRLELGRSGLSTTIYGGIKAFYPYGERLLLFERPGGAVQRLTDQAAAQRHLGAADANASACPPGKEGYGVTLLPIDRLLSGFRNW